MSDFVKNSNNDQLPPSSGSWHLLFLLLAVAFVCVWLEMQFKLLSNKTPKSALWRLYGVSNDTFNKWVKYFATDLVNYENYVRKRQLTLLEVLTLIGILGIPEEIASVTDMKPAPILRKQNIVEMGEGSYRSLRSSVNEYHTAFQVSPEAFARLSKFPPSISAHLLEMYG